MTAIQTGKSRGTSTTTAKAGELPRNNLYQMAPRALSIPAVAVKTRNQLNNRREIVRTLPPKTDPRSIPEIQRGKSPRGNP